MLNRTGLVPKNPDGVLWLIQLGRVSTPRQNQENIDASYEYDDTYLDALYKGPKYVKRLGEQGSGMLTERPTIIEAVELIATGKFDAVIMEDLSKAYRNPRWAMAFVQDAVDAGVRVIIPGDGIDTADENWEVTLQAAALRHGLHIPDTRRRVRRTAVYAFHKGGMVGRVRFGYRKLTKEQAESGEFGPKDLRIAKIPELTPVIRDLRRRYLAGESFLELSRWLNKEGILPGPSVKSRKWTAGLVQALLEDPILSGQRTFRKTIYRPIFKSGKHRREKNSAPETADYPSLAHLTVEEGEELRREIARRKAENRNHDGSKRRNVARAQSIWPGQAAICGPCDGPLHAIGEYIKCAATIPGRGEKDCWNHVQVPMELTRTKVVAGLLGVVGSVPGARALLVRTAWEHQDEVRRRRNVFSGSIDDEVASLRDQAKNIADAIAKGGKLNALVAKLAAIEKAIKKAEKRKPVQEEDAIEDRVFNSAQELDAHLEEVLRTLLRTSYDFADFIRRITVSFVITPVQALDTPLVRPRAYIVMDLARIPGVQAELGMVTQFSLKLDLFDQPKHIAAMARCIPLKAANRKLSLKKMEALLGINHMTLKRAFDYARRMQAAGLTEPYRELSTAPEGASRWRHAS